MKVIGLLGGMSWESSAEYYRMINEEVRRRLGGQNSAKILLYSVNFYEFEHAMHKGDWNWVCQELIVAAKRLESGGAECLVVCTNTMHKLAPAIEAQVKLPLLHIIEATGEKIQAHQFSTVGLLGTKFTMEGDFYCHYLEKKFGINVLIPNEKDRVLIHRVIFEELCVGKILESSRKEYLRIIQSLNEQGAQAVILGCTEIRLLLNLSLTTVPLLDTTELHVLKAVEFSLTT